MAVVSKLGTVALVLACVASSPARAEFMDMWARHDDVGEGKTPRTGASRVLVIPVEIRNAGFAPLDRDRLVEFFEQPGEDVLRFPSYWDAASNGRLQLEAEVAPTIVFDGCPAELGLTCTVDRGELSALAATVELMRTVVRRLDEGCFTRGDTCDPAAGLDFSAFDTNGPGDRPDGYVDGVILATNLPGVRLALPMYRVNAAGPNDLAGGRGGAFQLDDVQLPVLALCGDPGAPGTIEGVCLSEFGHLLGLAELEQDAVWRTRRPDRAYVGLEGSLMGSWRQDLSAPFPDAESRYRLGWAEVDVVSGTQRLTLRPAANGGRIAKLGVRSAEREEYYLVEARGPVGPYDRNYVRAADGAPAYGLAVYHVNWARGPTGAPGTWAIQLLDCLNCDPWASYVTQVQADGRYEIQENQPFRPEEDLFMGGDAFFPSHDTAPFSAFKHVWSSNWFDGSRSEIEIRDVQVDPVNGFVTAEFTAPEVADACADVVCGPGESCSAGNCEPPAAPSEPDVPDPADAKPPRRGPGGWGCAAGGEAGLVAFVLAVLVRGRRKLQRLKSLSNAAFA